MRCSVLCGIALEASHPNCKGSGETDVTADDFGPVDALFAAPVLHVIHGLM